MNETISIPNKQLARELVKTNASMLQNASITSITIPFIRKTTTSTTATTTPNSNPFFNLNLQSRGEIANNNDNNDLTELSWLTNNVQIFNKSTSMNHLSVQHHHHHKKSNFYNNQPSKVMLTNSASSAFSNYNKLLNSRNNFQYSVNNNKATKKSSKKIVKHEPIVTNNNNNNEDDSSYSSSYSSSTSSPLSIQPTTKLSNSYSISPSSSTSSSFSSSSSSSNSKKEFKKLNKSNEFYASDTKQDVSNSVSVSSSSATAKISITKQQDDLSFNNYTTQFKNSCGMNKPPLTLSCLIFMALQESNEKCLPVREIYEWIEQHFPFYKNVSNGGWKSSIRHNLSFSKCFRKMERNETYFNRPKQTLENNNNNKNNDSVENQRKRRAPNSTGTCWTVSSECKSYLVQTLKKSSFWFHNSKNYPNLNEYVVNFSLEATNESTPIRIDDHHFKNSTNLARKNSNKKLKLSANDLLIKPIKNKHLTTNNNNNNNNTKSDDESDNDNDDDDDYDNNDLNDQSEEEKQLNLFKFVQKQQEELCKKNYSPNSSFDSNYSNKNINESLKIRQDLDSNDLAAAAVLASSACSSSASSPKHNKKPKSIVDLSLSSSSSSLSSAFSLLSSHFTSSNQSNELEKDCQKKQQQEISSSACLNSDLEMEVASTLVGMKFFARKNN